MAVPEASQNDAENNRQTPVDVDVLVLRRQREQAFREVGFAAVAEQKAVNGYSTIITTEKAHSGLVTPRSSATNPVSDSCLRTPLIDISTLGSSSGNDKNEDEPKQQQHPQQGESNQTVLMSPEAGLHRDGEQARLVEVVRRRQLQQEQLNEETTFQWLEENAYGFWESILVYGGLLDDPRNDPFRRSRHATSVPLNPHRDNSRPQPNNIKSKHEQNSNTLSSSDPKRNDHPTSQLTADGPPSSQPSSLSKYPRIIRFIFYTIMRVLYALRRATDFCITRLGPLDPLPPNDSSSRYTSSPVYSLSITADEILRSIVILCVSFYCSSRLQLFAGPVVIMVCLFIRSVSRKVVRRTNSSENQSQIQRPQQSSSQFVKRKEAIPEKMPEPSTLITPTNNREASVQRLQQKHPNATYAECIRFFTCVKYKEEAASNRIGLFFKWRSECGLQTVAEAEVNSSGKYSTLQKDSHSRVFDQAFVKTDAADWNAAAKLAMSIITKSHVTECVAKLPQIICSYEGHFEESIDAKNKNKQSAQPPPRCKDGTRILHILPFSLDLSLATAPTYSLAAALYLDRRLSRCTTERITLVCDVRGGRGWANPTPWSTLPFIQSTASLLGSHYPERLERLVLFPMPKSAIWVWSAAQKCLDPNTSSKVVVVSSGEGSGLPEQLTEFVDEESLNVLEKRRRSFFIG